MGNNGVGRLQEEVDLAVMAWVRCCPSFLWPSHPLPVPGLVSAILLLQVEGDPLQSKRPTEVYSKSPFTSEAFLYSFTTTTHAEYSIFGTAVPAREAGRTGLSAAFL